MPLGRQSTRICLLGQLNSGKKHSLRTVNKLVGAKYWLVTAQDPEGFRYEESSQHSEALLPTDSNEYSPKTMAKVLRKHP